MASSPDVDNYGPCSSFLFTKEDGTPLKFFIRPSETKTKLKTLIEARGGIVSSKLVGSEADWIKLAAEGDRIISNNYIKAKFIEDCIAEDEFLPMDGYRLPPKQSRPPSPSSTTISNITCSTQGRQYYTKNDDLAILTYIAKHTDCKFGGNQIWMKMEMLKITDHSWQSMRHRFLKKLERYLGDFIKDQKKAKAGTGKTLNGGIAESSGSKGEASSGWVSTSTAPWTSSPRVKASLKFKNQPALVSTGAVNETTATKGFVAVNAGSASDDDIFVTVSNATGRANESVADEAVSDDSTRITSASTSNRKVTSTSKELTGGAAAEPAGTGTDSHDTDSTAVKLDQSGTSSDSEFDVYLIAEADKTSTEIVKAETETVAILDSQDTDNGGRNTSQDEDLPDPNISKQNPFRVPRKSPRKKPLKRDLVENTHSSSEDGRIHQSPRHKHKRHFILNDDSDDNNNVKRADREELSDSDSSSFLGIIDNNIHFAKDVQKLSGIIKRAMEKCSVSEKTVAQFIYMHSGDVAQALEHMETQELPEGKILWSMEDDDALNSLNPQDIQKVIKKFGQAEVMRRQVFFLDGE